MEFKHLKHNDSLSSNGNNTQPHIEQPHADVIRSSHRPEMRGGVSSSELAGHTTSLLAAHNSYLATRETEFIFKDMFERIRIRNIKYKLAVEKAELLEKSNYPASLRTTLYFSETEREIIPQTDLQRGNYDYFHLVKTDFILPGLGESGQYCESMRITHFSKDLDAIKEGMLMCKRMACPSCYSDWLKQRAFNMTLALELSAYAQGQRPVNGIISVSPNKITDKGWRWDNVNVNLFQYPYRKLKARGVPGGASAFHPFRIRGDIKMKLKSMRSRIKNANSQGYSGDIGLWKMVRDDMLKLRRFYDYVDLSPHVHFMGVPSGDDVGYNKTKGLVIRYQVKKDHDTGKMKPHRLRTVKDVLGKCFYLLTHTGSLILDKEYTKATRRFGNLQGQAFHNMVAKIPTAEIDRIKHEIASAMDMIIKPDGSLGYPEKVVTGEEKEYTWLPLHELHWFVGFQHFDDFEDEKYWKFQFFENILKIMRNKSERGELFFPELSELGEIPDGVSLIREERGDSFSERTEPFQDVKPEIELGSKADHDQAVRDMIEFQDTMDRLDSHTSPVARINLIHSQYGEGSWSPHKHLDVVIRVGDCSVTTSPHPENHVARTHLYDREPTGESEEVKQPHSPLSANRFGTASTCLKANSEEVLA